MLQLAQATEEKLQVEEMLVLQKKVKESISLSFISLSLSLCLSCVQEFEKQLVEITQTQEKTQVEIEEKLVQQFLEEMQTQLDAKVKVVEEQKKKVIIVMFY